MVEDIGNKGYKVNIGCGPTPIPGYLNFDNCLIVIIARIPFVLGLCKIFGLLKKEYYDQYEFGKIILKHDIKWADGSRHIPLPNSSVRIVYSSHMLEHLDREETIAFLQEVHRVLIPGGWLRLLVPDLAKFIKRYNETGDADDFIDSLKITTLKPKNFIEWIRRAVVGPRHHLWMYDEVSLVRLLRESGFFEEVEALPPGVTKINDIGEVNLYERKEESVYVEAHKAYK